MRFKRKQYRKALASALGAVARTGAKDAVSYLALDGVGDADTLRAGAHRRGSRGEFAVPHSRSQDGQQAAEADAGKLRHRASTGRGERGNAERGLEHGQGIVAGMA